MVVPAVGDGDEGGGDGDEPGGDQQQPRPLGRHQSVVPVDNTSVSSSGIILGRHQYNIIRALYLWTTPVFQHQGVVPVDNTSIPTSGLIPVDTSTPSSGLIPVDIISITSSAHCTCR